MYVIDKQHTTEVNYHTYTRWLYQAEYIMFDNLSSV